MPTVNKRILEAQIKPSVYLERYKGGVLKKIIGLLNATEEDLISLIAARLTTIEGRGFDLFASETNRLEKLLQDIRMKREDVYSVLDKQLSGEMGYFSEYEADFQIRLSNDAGVQAALVMPSNAQLKAIVTSQPFPGRLLNDWARDLEQEEFKRLNDAIRIGITEGQTTDQIVRHILGTKKNRYHDEILEISRREAEAITRTAVSDVANRARSEVYNANADIVQKLQYVAMLDSRTTLICASRDGKVYDLGKVPALPAHFRCRSVLIAYFEGDEVGDRASFTGPIPASKTFSEFLKSRVKSFRRKFWALNVPSSEEAQMTVSSPLIGLTLAGALAFAVPTVTYYEGLRLSTYIDPVVVPTICYGSTVDVTLGQTGNRSECDRLLNAELGQAISAVDRLVKVKMPDTRRAALGSFVYNVGVGAFARSTILKKLNSGDVLGE